MHLINRMLQKEPEKRPKPADGEDKSQCMQVVLQHPFFLTSTEKLAAVMKEKDSKWQRLRGETLKNQSGDWRSCPGLKRYTHSTQSSQSAHSTHCTTGLTGLTRIKEAAEKTAKGGTYGKDLAELARLVRNVRQHLHENAELGTIFGVNAHSDDTTANDKVVQCFAHAVPCIFHLLIEWQ